ncbi:MAG: hypothetical protein KF736_13850 [Acidobacteria bacterium]|nr:hypothetical protein [Acidobacteriota bacterium]MCW5949055.1 hypothetical protein [Pyrinomonadaceae bacterium]
MNTKTKYGSTEDQATTSPAADNVLDFSSTLKKLRSTVDPAMIRQRAGRRDRNGNMQMVEYVEWHTVADILDETAPDWCHEVKNIRAIGEIITVTVALTINGVTREGIGTGKVVTETGIKKAEHDALKRAAVKFGIARELYKKEFDSIDPEVTAAAEDPASVPDHLSEPIARTLGDMLSAKQLGMIRAIGRNTGIDTEAQCRSLLGCGVEELSKRAASNLIDHLRALESESSIPARRAV